MPTARRRSPSLERERDIYARVIATMQYPEASTLLHELMSARERRMTPHELKAQWRDVRREPDAAWSMYIHVPYCKSICTFCNYKRLRVSSKEALDEYVAFIDSETKLFAPAFEDVTFGAIYIGGGTPSVLDAPQLDRMLGAIGERFRFHPDAQKNFEYDPMVMTEERFKVVHRHGFRRFSFGIQSIDVEVNALHNRGRQARGHVDKQFELLARHGHAGANVDFLLGLWGTTPEQMLAEIEEVLGRHRPSEVSIYFITPTEHYVAQHFDGDYGRYEAFLAPFHAKMPAALAELATRLDYDHHDDGRHGIRMSEKRQGHNPPAVHAYCDIPSQVHRPLYVLGIGDSARSRIFGQLHYRAEHDTDDRDADSARYLGSAVSIEDEMFSYLAFVFRDGDALDRALFRRTFACDVLEAFARPIDKLVSLGALRIDPNAIVLERQSARDRLRDLLFFLPATRRKQLGAKPRDRGELTRALAAMRDRDWAGADKLLAANIDNDGDQALSLALRAAARAKSQRQREARADLKRLASHDGAAVRQAGRVLAGLGLHVEVAELYQRAHNVELVGLAADACLRVGRYHEGLAALRAAGRRDDLARTLHRFGAHDEAAALLDADSDAALRFDVAVARGEHHAARALAGDDVARLIAVGQLGRARAVADDAVSSAPSRVAWLARGALCLWADELDEAIRCGQAALDAAPEAAQRLIGAAHVRRGAIDEADAALSAAGSDHAETLLWRGELARRRGEYDTAIRLLEAGIAATEGYPIAAHACRQLAALEQHGRSGAPHPDAHSELLALLAPVAPHETGDVVARLRACVDAMAGNLTARPSYLRDGELTALDVRLHTRFAARALQDQLRALAPDVVLSRLRALERERAGEPTVACHIGEIELWLGRYDDAHHSFARAIEATPDVRWAYIGLCAAALGQGDLQEAIAWCERGVAAFPPPGRTLFAYRGEAYRRSGDGERARADFERAHALTPDRISAWINMALLYPPDRASTLARIERRAPGLVADALAEHPLEGGHDVSSLLEHMLVMMRQNRSSTFVTYHTADGALRFVPMLER